MAKVIDRRVSYTITFNDRELGIIHAALHYWDQQLALQNKDAWPHSEVDELLQTLLEGSK